MKVAVKARGLGLEARLHPLDLELAGGELCGLIGPNGGGKTSLLHALAGIGGVAGTVEIDGNDPGQAPPGKRHALLSFLPAGRDLAWPLPARDVIRLGGASEAQVDRMIDRLDLRNLADRRVDRLSTGERSRVQLARALAPEPRLLLLDEPIANLDPYWRLRVMDLVQDDVQRLGQAVLVAMHDLDMAAAFVTRLLLVNRGRIVADGGPELLDRPIIARVFGVERKDGRWRRTFSPPVDPQSLP